MQKNIIKMSAIASIILSASAHAQHMPAQIVHNPMLDPEKQRNAPYVVPSETDFLISSLINVSVKNLKNETIGQLKDFVIQGKEVRGIVLAVSGFLGMGERYIVLDPSTIKISLDGRSWSVVTDASKETLKNAPPFKYEGRWGL